MAVFRGHFIKDENLSLSLMSYRNQIVMLRINIYIIITLLVFNTCRSGQESKPFSFVQICDTQLGFGLEGYEQDLESFKQAVRQINELNPEFVVICGDLVNNPTDSTYSDFTSIMKNFNMPCHCVPGNHDVGNIPNDTTLSYYRKTIGKDYYEFKSNGYSFIVTNTQLWKANVKNESEKHDKWFKETLHAQSIKQNPVFVIGHHPLYLKDNDEEEVYYNFPLNKRKEILKLFKQNNVLAYLSGHTHKTVINNYENIQLVSGETLSKNFDKKPLGFRVWEVSLDTVKQHFIPL